MYIRFFDASFSIGNWGIMFCINRILFGLIVILIIPSTNGLLAISLEEYKEKLQEIQSLSDDKNLDKEAILRFQSLRGVQLEFSDSKKYQSGLEISIFLLARKINDYDLMNQQLERILRAGNQEFIAMERYSIKQPGVIYSFWLYGYTIPHILILYVYKNQFGRSEPDAKFKELRSLLQSYNNLSYGRLSGSTSATTYGNECVHLLYFDKGIPLKQKYSYLKEFSEIAKGSSAEGNAHLSMALVSKELNEKEQMREHANMCIKILNKHLDEHLYNETMMNMCEGMK